MVSIVGVGVSVGPPVGGFVGSGVGVSVGSSSSNNVGVGSSDGDGNSAFALQSFTGTVRDKKNSGYALFVAVFAFNPIVDIFSKAASLFHSLIFNHAFVDGDKRTSMTATTRFLYLNGYELDITQKEFIAFPLRVENNHLSFEAVAAWLKKNSRRVK